MNIKLEATFNSFEELRNFLDKKTMTIIGEEKPFIKVENIKDIVNSELRNNKPWTEFEDNYVIDNFYKYKGRVIAKSLGRSLCSINTRIQKFKKEGLLKNKFNKDSKVFSY